MKQTVLPEGIGIQCGDKPIKYILVVGMGRSGSTLLYNIIRFCVMQKEIQCIIKKHHAYDKELHKKSDIIFTTKRDIRDVIASWKRRHFASFDGIDYCVQCSKFIGYYNSWKDFSNYEFIFESYIKDRDKIIYEVAAVLGITDIDINDIKKGIDNLSKQTVFGIHTEHLLMAENHIGRSKIGSYKELLTPIEIQIIEKNYSEWLYDQKEYPDQFRKVYEK